MAVKKNAEVNTENVEVTETVEKEAVNVLDLLLGSDLGTIKQPYKDVEITRLSEALGAPFVVRCEALTPDTYEDVQENAITIKGKKTFAEVPAVLKDKVKEILIDLEVPELAE